MAERRVAKIVHQRERFRQIHVERERSRDGARDLRHFDRMGEPVAEMIGIAAGKNLRLVFEPPKGTGVNNAIAVALIVVAIRMRRFREAASAGLFHLHRVAGQHGNSLALLIADF